MTQASSHCWGWDRGWSCGSGCGSTIRFAKSHAGRLTARIDVSHCVSAETFDRLPALGQFTLRDEGCTIAMGRIRSLLIKKKQSGPVVSSS